MINRKAPPINMRNCVKGDWAICIHGKVKGRVVRCIKWLGKIDGWTHSDRWQTDVEFTSRTQGSTKTTFSAGDFNLRPLRGTFEEIVAQVVAFRLENK